MTGFEIAIPYRLGKPTLAEPPRELLEARIRNNGLDRLPVSLAHTDRLALLPLHPRDPFDRRLIAQALEDDRPILSADSALDAYGVERLR